VAGCRRPWMSPWLRSSDEGFSAKVHIVGGLEDPHGPPGRDSFLLADCWTIIGKPARISSSRAGADGRGRRWRALEIRLGRALDLVGGPCTAGGGGRRH